MKLSQIKFFCAVVEHGTVAAAAKALNCVPSNITIRVRELESQLNVALFIRERNRLFVTPEGRLLYEKAGTLLALASETQQLFEGNQPSGSLNVGALDAVLSNHLPPHIANYRRARPRVRLNIHPGHSFALERRLVDGELDVIVSDGPIEHPLLASSIAFRESLMLITPKAIRRVSAEWYAEHELYVFGTSCYYRQLVDAWISRNQVTPRAVLEIESYPIMFACVAAGHGFAFVPASFFATYQRGYSVRAHQLDDIGSADTYFVWRKHQASALVPDFIDNCLLD
ncbi:LysR family transcriptional regulator [Burkholderia stabilis]